MPEWRYTCPRGHTSIELYATRFKCNSCYRNDEYEEYTWPKDDLVDREEGRGRV